MDVTNFDQSLMSRLSVLLAQRADVTVHYLDGTKSNIYGPVQVGRDHLVFRGGLTSHDDVVVPFHAICRLHLR